MSLKFGDKYGEVLEKGGRKYGSEEFIESLVPFCLFLLPGYGKQKGLLCQ